jgi:hypothetical protein
LGLSFHFSEFQNKEKTEGQGVSHARKTVQWTVFSKKRAAAQGRKAPDKIKT